MTLKQILDSCKHHGVKFDSRIAKLAELQELLFDAERERCCLQEDGASTTVIDDVIAKLRRETKRFEEET